MVLRKVVRSGDIVFDIGANVGQFTRLLSHLIGQNGEVHAFEPIPPVFRKLDANIKSSGLPSKMFLNQCALSDKTGIIQMYVPDCDFTQASTVKHTTASWAEENSDTIIDTYEQVQAKTLDQYVSEKGLGEISFIKCDVEGAELLVLKGGVSLLKRKSPPILLLEVCKEWIKDLGYDSKELFEFLMTEFGYRFIYLGRDGLAILPLDFNNIPGEFPDYLNFLCYIPDVHNSRIGSFLSEID
jgi:FkbM family methyltransferase